MKLCMKQHNQKKKSVSFGKSKCVAIVSNDSSYHCNRFVVFASSGGAYLDKSASNCMAITVGKKFWTPVRFCALTKSQEAKTKDIKKDLS